MIIYTDKGEVSFLEGDIIQIKLNADIHLQSADMKEFNAAKRELLGNKKHSVILISGAGSTISKEVLLMMCKSEPLAKRHAKAVVANALAVEFINNYFITANSSGLPLMAFSTKAKAIKWLNEL